MPKKLGFSMEQHRDIGKRLFAITEDLALLQAEIGNAYATKLSDRYVQTPRRRLRDLRSLLEDSMFKEHGDAGDIHAYYPGH